MVIHGHKLSLRERLAGAFGLPLTLVLLLVLLPVQAAQAAPQIPCQMYGNVTVNDAPAPAGTTLAATINGVEYANTVTDGSGRYGYDPNYFMVPADDPSTTEIEGGNNGDTIDLILNDVIVATATFTSGSLEQVNVSATVDGGNPPGQTAPEAPGSLTVTSPEYNQVMLNWIDNSNSETGFKISRSLDGSSFNLMYTTGSDVTTYYDISVDPETTYYYLITAFNDAGDSSLAGPVFVTTGAVPAPPAQQTSQPPASTTTTTTAPAASTTTTQPPDQSSTDAQTSAPSETSADTSTAVADATSAATSEAPVSTAQDTVTQLPSTPDSNSTPEVTAADQDTGSTGPAASVEIVQTGAAPEIDSTAVDTTSEGFWEGLSSPSELMPFLPEWLTYPILGGAVGTIILIATVFYLLGRRRRRLY